MLCRSTQVNFFLPPPAERPERRVSCRAPELLETATCSRTLQQGGYILKRSLGVETQFLLAMTTACHPLQLAVLCRLCTFHYCGGILFLHMNEIGL